MIVGTCKGSTENLFISFSARIIWFEYLVRFCVVLQKMGVEKRCRSFEGQDFSINLFFASPYAYSNSRTLFWLPGRKNSSNWTNPIAIVDIHFSKMFFIKRHSYHIVLSSLHPETLKSKIGFCCDIREIKKIGLLANLNQWNRPSILVSIFPLIPIRTRFLPLRPIVAEKSFQNTSSSC